MMKFLELASVRGFARLNFVISILLFLIVIFQHLDVIYENPTNQRFVLNSFTSKLMRDFLSTNFHHPLRPLPLFLKF